MKNNSVYRIVLKILGAVLFAAILFCLGLFTAYRIYLIYKEKPQSTYLPNKVVLSESNLPIIIIDTKGEISSMRRDKYITAQMIVIDNGTGNINYIDTVSHKQYITYDGLIKLRYRGNTTFSVDKKSYSVNLIASAKGDKQKAKLLDMKKSDKWCLLAEHRDLTLMRDALTYELARPFFDYVPNYRYCEVILDGDYLGVYLLAERITRDRLGLKKFDNTDDRLYNGYLLEKDHDNEISFYSRYSLYDPNPNAVNKKAGFAIKYPKPNLLTFEQLQTIKDDVIRLEDAINTRDYKIYSQYIDVESFLSFHLFQEFTNNPDGYIFSHKFYHRDGLFYMTLWDFDIAYGKMTYRNGLYVNTWQYDCDGIFWWHQLEQDSVFRSMISERWLSIRDGALSRDVIERKIDSLQTLLASHGAIDRNMKAWGTGNFDGEIVFLKSWINCRLDFMDLSLLNKPHDKIMCDEACRQVGRNTLYKKL